MRYNKYGNVRVATLDGIAHDSKKEARRWAQLNLLLKAGEIKDLRRQVKYELIPKQDGERACQYIADFVYFDCREGKEVVEDCKGKRTDVYIIKRKLMLWKYGIKILET